uniref:Uncharacterized protein n=1 Tax=Arundo donax TaxID=35708 RepID=A0A0A9EPW4_ARUDO
MIITASNDLNEETINALNKQVIKLPFNCVSNWPRIDHIFSYDGSICGLCWN